MKVLCPCKMVADSQSNVAMKKINPVLGYITENKYLFHTRHRHHLMCYVYNSDSWCSEKT